jgi:predicted small secreted protein
MKKTAQNDITGAWIVSKPNTQEYEKQWERIFGKKKKSVSRIEQIGQNGNDGIHYEYELDKSTGEIVKKDTNG